MVYQMSGKTLEYLTEIRISVNKGKVTYIHNLSSSNSDIKFYVRILMFDMNCFYLKSFN